MKIGLFLITAVSVAVFSFVGLSMITDQLNKAAFDEVDGQFHKCLPSLNALFLSKFAKDVDPSMIKQSIGIVVLSCTAMLLTPARTIATSLLLLFSLSTVGILMNINQSTAIPVGLVMLCIGMFSFLMDKSSDDDDDGKKEEVYQAMKEKMEKDMKQAKKDDGVVEAKKEEVVVKKPIDVAVEPKSSPASKKNKPKKKT